MRVLPYVLAASLLAGACRTPPLPRSSLPEEQHTIATVDATAQRDGYRLGPNDLVRVAVLMHPQLSTPELGSRVDGEGLLHLPLIGAVPAGGATVRELVERCQERLQRFVKEPSVSVSVVEWAARRVYVFGAVTSPGAYVLDRPLNALQALALSGGTAPFADRAAVCLLRQSGEFVEVHVFNAETPDADGLVAVRDGDFLFVRLSGTGTFREEVMPVLQGIQPMVSSLISLGLVADAIDG